MRFLLVRHGNVVRLTFIMWDVRPSSVAACLFTLISDSTGGTAAPKLQAACLDSAGKVADTA